MTQPKYFLVKFRSPTYYNEDRRIIVDSQKQLKDFVRQDAKFMLEEYGDGQRLNKRMHTGHMYREPNDEIVGKVFEFKMLAKDARKLTDKQIENFEEIVFQYWCEKIAKKDLYKFAGFERIGL